ncbi:sugar phosphate nucleotidyltransferase [Mycolicibacterium sphagni]|uniref:sugar phosphate nucleotidyltransferase n=1 Tax=Mycolicibacterium sphagni TaxID=1786 RepID=UPI0021F2BAF3|nr:sugar phosphate nucleotidyltransferase [Mycolicibacterium sphagni]
MQLVVLAGGFGTRLRGAIPEGLPKPMAPIGSKPFLEHLLDRGIAQGVRDIHLLVGYRAEIITGHFGAAYRDVPISYSFEETPLGTGGALKAAAAQLADEFVFANGDTFADCDYPDLLDRLGSGVLSMTLAAIADVSRYGSVVTEGDVAVRFREKGATGPGMVNAGTYGCRRELLGMLPERASFSFETDFLEPALPKLRPPFQIVKSGIIDIGTPESYRLAEDVFGQ